MLRASNKNNNPLIYGWEYTFNKACFATFFVIIVSHPDDRIVNNSGSPIDLEDHFQGSNVLFIIMWKIQGWSFVYGGESCNI